MSCSSLETSPAISRQGSFSSEEPVLTTWEKVALAIVNFFCYLYSCIAECFGKKDRTPSPALPTEPPSPRNRVEFVEMSVEFTVNQKLLHACEQRSFDEISSLLKDGASLETTDRKGVTALMILCCQHFLPEGFLETILKDCPASVLTKRDRKGWTALNYEIANGYYRLFEPYLDRFDEKAQESAVCTAMRHGCASYFLDRSWGKGSRRVQFEQDLAGPEFPSLNSDNQ